jgi:hypothetical protein
LGGGSIIIHSQSASLLAATTGDGKELGPLSQSDANAFVAYAVQLWGAVGAASPPQPLHVIVADLPGNLLGTTNGTTITLDTDAAGIGWFVDATPGANEEFAATRTLAASGSLTAAPGSAAFSHYDLLTVAAHEVGHALGFEHGDDDHGVMAETLAVGRRRLPAEDHEPATAIAPGSITPVVLLAINVAVTNEHQLQPDVVPVFAPLHSRDDFLLDEPSTEETVELPLAHTIALGDDEFSPDALFADYEGSLADALLTA